jgi:hypothetical protein
MSEALINPEGHFPDGGAYRFCDVKRVMAWVFECFFDICLGYGRPSMFDSEIAEIMRPDGSTPIDPGLSILPFTAWVLSGYDNKMYDLTDQDLDFLCQEFVNIALVRNPRQTLGTLQDENAYEDPLAATWLPNNVCFSLKNIIANTFPGRQIRYYHAVMSNSHPLIMNLAFAETHNFISRIPYTVEHTVHVSDTGLTAVYDMALLKIHDSLKLINDDYFMSNLVRQALHVAKDGVIKIADNKDENVGKEIASIVVSSQTALMTTLTKAISGQGKEITLHANIISQEGYDDNFVCYVNESSTTKTFKVNLESMDSIEVWFKDGENNIIDLNDPDKKVKFRVELLLETVD